MNTVPGVPTRFKMTPTITTVDMRKKVGNDKFNYVLLCNKVCGAAHSNMKIPVRVVTMAEYEAWLKEQKTYMAAVDSKEAPADTTMQAEPSAPKMN
jgi:cytochrome c oxidase subunit 2